MKKTDFIDNYNKPFPTILRHLIKERKTTIKAVADYVGITRQAVSQYQDGSTQPNADTLIKIANYFNVSVDYLLGLAKQPTKDKELNEICEYTGLSQNAILTLVELNKKSNSRAYIDLLSCIISADNFEYLLGLLEGYAVPSKENISTTFSMSKVDIDYKDLCMFAINNTLRSILDKAALDFICKYKSTEERLDILFEDKVKRGEI